MKRKPSPAKLSDRSQRSQSDNLCKRLAEQYPAQFAAWLFGAGGQVKVEKTELSREPIRADAVIFSHAGIETMHVEFQTTAKSDVPVPLRMLDYYVGLKRKQPGQRVRQVLIVLKPMGEQIPDRYEDEWTVHRYHLVRLWEQDPAELLKHEGLLPLATLCRDESGEKLLSKVAAQIKQIKSPERQREVVNASRVLAGLRYDRGLINRTLKESDMLEESVIYQDILQRGAQRGAHQEGKTIALRQLERRFGKLPRTVQRQIEQLVIEQLEALCEALLDFRTKDDLSRWLKQHAAAR